MAQVVTRKIFKILKNYFSKKKKKVRLELELDFYLFKSIF